MGPTTTPPGKRPCTEAPVDAGAAAALCAGGEDGAAAPAGPRAPPCGVRDPGGRRAGACGVRLADQHGVYRGATRWSKGSRGFRVDREVIINLVTQFSMRVQIPPSRCRSDSISPRPATGPQRSAAGISGGPWKPQYGYPVSQASMDSVSKGVFEPS